MRQFTTFGHVFFLCIQRDNGQYNANGKLYVDHNRIASYYFDGRSAKSRMSTFLWSNIIHGEFGKWYILPWLSVTVLMSPAAASAALPVSIERICLMAKIIPNRGFPVQDLRQWEKHRLASPCLDKAWCTTALYCTPTGQRHSASHDLTRGTSLLFRCGLQYCRSDDEAVQLHRAGIHVVWWLGGHLPDEGHPAVCV